MSLKAKSPAGPVTVTIETERASSGALSSKIGTKFSYAKFNLDKGQLLADGGQVIESSLSLTPEIKLSFKSSKGADLGIDYSKGNFYATGALDVLNMSKASTSLCLAHPSGFKVGGDATYALSGKAGGLSDFSLGTSYSKGPIYASLTATNKLGQYNIGLLYNVNSNLTLASQTAHTSAKVCTVLAIGGAYKNSALGTIKAKVGSNGIVHACIIREIAPKVTLTASGCMSATDPSTFKPGLSITM